MTSVPVHRFLGLHGLHDLGSVIEALAVRAAERSGWDLVNLDRHPQAKVAAVLAAGNGKVEGTAHLSRASVWRYVDGGASIEFEIRRRGATRYEFIADGLDLPIELENAIAAWLDAVDVEEALTSRPPVATVGPDDQPLLPRDLEGLLTEAGRFVDDESEDPELRDLVDLRRRTLAAELRLPAGGNAIIIEQAAAYLMQVLRPELVDVDGEPETDAEIVQHAIDVIVHAAPDLGGPDDLATEAAERVLDAMDAVAAIETSDEAYEIGEPTVGRVLDGLEAAAGGDPAVTEIGEAPAHPHRDAIGRGYDAFLEGDLWSKHVNRVITGILSAGGVLGANAVTGGRASAILRGAASLIRARWPWIFPPA